MTQENRAYPVNIRGDLSVPPSRGWWLLKWLLAIPHIVVICFLFIGFVFSWIISFFSILFTEKYPKSLFDYNVGVIRWSWRVLFYAYNVLGTDKYPPFSLDPDPNYPADIEVEYPEKLSRGLVLVKWWLLAIPHYLIVSVFEGFYKYTVNYTPEGMKTESELGLIGIIVIISAIALLFTGKYPGSLFKLVMGMNRWSIRVCAYAALMTDEYPPFRLWDD
jgi:hypothetical protein